MRIVRGVLGVVGELLVTAGVIVLLFVAWQVGYSSLIEGREQAGIAAQLQQELAQGKPGMSALAST